MNKNAKKIIVFLVVILSCIGVYKLADTVSYPFVEKKAEIYLCKKYNVKSSEIELIDYNQSHIYWDDPNIFWLTPVWIDFSFEYKYNGRDVFVNRIDGKFYDDYQINEIEQWCTQWLQENIDEKIIGIEINSTYISNYLSNVKQNNYYIFDENDTEDFLNKLSLISKNNYSTFILFNDENTNWEFISNEKDIICEKAQKKINEGVYVWYTESYLVKISQKYEDGTWYNFYDTKINCDEYIKNSSYYNIADD